METNSPPAAVSKAMGFPDGQIAGGATDGRTREVKYVLPTDVRRILVQTPEADLDTLAKTADGIVAPGKRQSQCKIEGTTGLNNAPSICAINSSSISVTDIISGRSFLVDTGAEESVFPASYGDRKKSSGPNLVAANGSAISTYGHPVHARARRLDKDKLSAAKAEFEELEGLGIVRRSSSAWSSPLHIVKKSNGGWRPCGDYRWLNDVTKDDRYPLPYIQDLNSNLRRKTIFSKIDLVRGYHQIPVAEEDIPKTAIITPFGLYEYLTMPFGLKNAAQAFQRLMDGILQNLRCCFVYLDDMLVASTSPQEHEADLRSVFQSLAANGLVINTQKFAEIEAVPGPQDRFPSQSGTWVAGALK
ncbi:hypothetical protein EGW08_017793 [Elysia chlorotica]|uniref:Reverse transcriptase domain-containing protein n=1 Tax=Elysia chlorotica TaxID=188477 RepID=A0A433SYS4_ELYCH|nr:hypothetical protein EGW08_017793 [Elysia chlorotica]